MTTLTETQHAGEFLVSEANKTRSRETVVVLSGQNLKAGHVVGKVAVGAATPAAVAGNTGDGTIGTVTLGAGAKSGVYRVVCIEPATNAGEFSVEDPEGVTVGVATVAVEFTGGGLTFTIADGATDFAAGDSFTITVAVGTLKVKEWNPANTDGSDVAAGVLFDAVNATAADMPGVIIRRDAEVNDMELQWFSGASGGNKTTGKAQLAELGIIAR